MKIRLMVKFTKHPAVVNQVNHSATLQMSPVKEKREDRLKNNFDFLRYSFYKNIDLQKPSRPYQPPVYDTNFVQHNVELKGQRDHLNLRDRSQLVKVRKAAKLEELSLKKDYLDALAMLKEQERCQKQIDHAKMVKNQFLIKYYLSVMYLFRTVDGIRDKIMVEWCFYIGSEVVLFPKED